MDASASTTTNRARRLGFAVWGVIILLELALDLAGRANLVDRIPAAITFTSGAASFAAGVWLSFGLQPPPASFGDSVRQTVVRLGMPLFAMFTGTFLARTAVEAAAFAGMSPTRTPSEAFVINEYRSKWGELSAGVSFGPGKREVDVEITPDLFYRLEPYRAPGRDCLVLSTETGRWGVRRSMLPRRLFDDRIGVDRYVKCAQQPPERVNVVPSDEV